MRSRPKASGGFMLSTALIVILILMLIGAFPAWPYNRGWSYGPSAIIALIFAILLAMSLLGKV
jgi:hypothetical protein